MSREIGTAVRSGHQPSDRRSEPREAEGSFLTRTPVVITVVVFFLVAMNQLLQGGEGVQPGPQVEAAAAEVSVILATEMVEQYRRDNGELPPTLSAVNLSDDQYRYRPGRDGTFVLETTAGTQSVRYDSAEGPVELVRAVASQAGGSR